MVEDRRKIEFDKVGGGLDVGFHPHRVCFRSPRFQRRPSLTRVSGRLRLCHSSMVVCGRRLAAR